MKLLSPLITLGCVVAAAPVIAADVQPDPPITTLPVKPIPRSRPLFDVNCQLRDLDFGKSYEFVLSQYGGIYEQKVGQRWGGQKPTYVKVTRDDLGIFDDQPMEMFGNRITDWYSDGPFELIAHKYAGAITFYKSAGRTAFWQSPTQVGVTAEVGQTIRDGQNKGQVKEFILVGSCNVAWVDQKAVLPDDQEGGRS